MHDEGPHRERWGPSTSCPVNTLSNCGGGVVGSVQGRSPGFMGGWASALGRLRLRRRPLPVRRGVGGVRVALGSLPADPGRENEDFAAAASGAAVLLDGAGAAGAETGVHAWRRLALRDAGRAAAEHHHDPPRRQGRRGGCRHRPAPGRGRQAASRTGRRLAHWLTRTRNLPGRVSRRPHGAPQPAGWLLDRRARPESGPTCAPGCCAAGVAGIHDVAERRRCATRPTASNSPPGKRRRPFSTHPARRADPSRTGSRGRRPRGAALATGQGTG